MLGKYAIRMSSKALQLLGLNELSQHSQEEAVGKVCNQDEL